jgi:hypothetical protein
MGMGECLEACLEGYCLRRLACRFELRGGVVVWWGGGDAAMHLFSEMHQSESIKSSQFPIVF